MKMPRIMPALLDSRLWFPDPRSALTIEPYAGLMALGGDLSPGRLLLAYRSGVFPWTVNPITWWSPDPRAIFEFAKFHVPRSLQKFMRRSSLVMTMDKAFKQVMEGCAEPAPGRQSTWVTPEFIQAYGELHRLGFAHSVECWQSGQLVGGIYGVAIGGFFAAESMFRRVSNASKVALCHLVQHLGQQGFGLMDIQMPTPTTQMMGAVSISRDEYLLRLKRALQRPCRF